MGNKGFANRAKSGQKAFPAKLQRIKHRPAGARPRQTGSAHPPQNGSKQDADAPLQVQVEAYAGARAEQTPRRFTVGGRTVAVMEVTRQWRTPDHDHFQVLGDDGVTYLLQYDHASGCWECTEQRAIP